MEYIIDQINNEEQKVQHRSKAINIITNYLTRNTILKNNDKIVKDAILTKRFLQAHTNIVVTKADKGNFTVLLLKQDYINKSFSMLNDTKT